MFEAETKIDIESLENLSKLKVILVHLCKDKYMNICIYIFFTYINSTNIFETFDVFFKEL